MEPWEQALDKFLVDWRKRKEVIGILVCGSYVTGDPSEHSDIDIPIILSDKTKWKERGNKVVDGYLMEYFTSPPWKYKKFFEDEYENNRNLTATMFVTGRIIYDKNGAVKKLKKEAQSWLNKKPKPFTKEEIESNKYYVWDVCDNLQEAYNRKSPSFAYTYHDYLHSVLWVYSKLIGHAVSARHNTFEFLTDEKTQKKYLVKEFPDHKFAGMFVSAMDETDKEWMMKHAIRLKDYVLDKMGGFDIDCWRLKTSVDTEEKKTKIRSKKKKR